MRTFAGMRIGVAVCSLGGVVCSSRTFLASLDWTGLRRNRVVADHGFLEIMNRPIGFAKLHHHYAHVVRHGRNQGTAPWRRHSARPRCEIRRCGANVPPNRIGLRPPVPGRARAQCFFLGGERRCAACDTASAGRWRRPRRARVISASAWSDRSAGPRSIGSTSLGPLRLKALAGRLLQERLRRIAFVRAVRPARCPSFLSQVQSLPQVRDGFVKCGRVEPCTFAVVKRKTARFVWPSGSSGASRNSSRARSMASSVVASIV